jgi:hypothetical protein
VALHVITSGIQCAHELFCGKQITQSSTQKEQFNQAAKHLSRNIRFTPECLQYHPEVVHSERGLNTLKRFLTSIAGLKGDWSMRSAIEAEKQAVATKVGPDAHVICALSGGVDSTVAATLVHSVRSSLRSSGSDACIHG